MNEQQTHTIREAVNAFKGFSADRSGTRSSNNSWSSRLIYYYLTQHINQVVFEKRFRNTMSGVSEYIWQTLPCVELREVDRAEDCPCQPASGCKWLKSVHPLPKPLEGRVRSVVSNTGHETFDYLRWEHFQDKTRSRILAERTHPYFTWKSVDSKFHLYVYNRELLESVSVVMVPEDNLSLLQFPSCGKEIKPVCSMLDQPFILDRELQPLVFERTFRSLVNAKSVATNSDVLNNTNDDTASQVPLK